MKGFSKSGKLISYKGHYTEVIESYASEAPKLPANKEKYERLIGSDAHNDWRGGTRQDVITLPSLAPFIQAKERLEKNLFQKKLTPALANKKRRVRCLSEHDGDYSYDRRWELHPYSTAVRSNVRYPSVSIQIDFSLNCAYPAKQIDDYGALVWGLSQLIESQGISTSVDMIVDITSLDGGGVFSGKPGTINLASHIKIKESGEYMSPVAMASCFRTVFFRRPVFHMMVMGADFSGKEVSSGLGECRNFDKPVEFKNGVLRLTIGANNELEKLEKELLKIF